MTPYYRKKKYRKQPVVVEARQHTAPLGAANCPRLGRSRGHLMPRTSWTVTTGPDGRLEATVWHDGQPTLTRSFPAGGGRVSHGQGPVTTQLVAVMAWAERAAHETARDAA